jgi:hypothetical protein
VAEVEAELLQLLLPDFPQLMFTPHSLLFVRPKGELMPACTVRSNRMLSLRHIAVPVLCFEALEQRELGVPPHAVGAAWRRLFLHLSMLAWIVCPVACCVSLSPVTGVSGRTALPKRETPLSVLALAALPAGGSELNSSCGVMQRITSAKRAA